MRTNERRLPAAVPFSPGTDGDASNPARLAVITPMSVERIGSAAAEGLEQKADQLEAEARIVADKLRELAAAVRGHTEIANARVAAFCTMQAGVLETVVGLEARISGRAGEADDGADEVPRFLKKGPADGEADAAALN